MSVPAAPSILVRPGAYNGYLQFFWYDQGDASILYYTLTCTGVYTDSSFPPFNNSGMRYPAGLLTYKMDTGYLTNGVKYTFSITATNANGVSEPTTFRTVAPGVKPQPVASVSAVTYSDTSALVTWVSSGTVATPPVEWFVAQAISCNGADPLVQRSQYPYQSNVILSSLNAASQYVFRVYAVNDPGYSQIAASSTLTIRQVDTNELIVYLTAESYPGYGQWHDRSGNNYDAAIENGTATVNADKNGLVLNGSTNWRFPPTGPSGIGSHSNFTLQTWYKQTAAPTGAGASVVTEVFTGTTVNMAIQQGGYTSTSTDMVGGFFTNSWSTGPPFPVANDEWHNLAVTFNGSQLISYFDGYAIASNSYSNAYSASNNYYRIGRRWDLPDYVQGEIGQVLIYGRALSGAEVLQNVSTYVTVFPPVLQNVTLSTLQPADTALTLTWNQAPATKPISVTFYQSEADGVFANGSTIAASTIVNPPDEYKTLAVPLTRGYYYFGTAGLPAGTAYSSATAYYDYPTLSNAAMTNATLYTTTLGSTWSTNANYITGIQLYSNTTNATSNRTAVGPLYYLSTAQNSYSFPTSNYPSPLTPDTWMSADVTPFSTTRTVVAAPVKVAGPTYTNFTVSTISVGDTSLSAKWTPSVRYATNVQFYITTTATRPSGAYSTVGALQYIENSSLSSITLNVVPSTGLYYFAGITYSTGSLSTFTTPVVVPNTIQTVVLSSLAYQSQSLDTSWTATTPSAVLVSYYSTSTAASTGGTLLSSFSIPSGTTSNSFPTLPYAGAYYYATVQKAGSPAVPSADAKRGVNPLSTLSLSSLTAYASNLTASWLSAYNSTIALSFYDGAGLLSTVETSNGTSNYTLDYNPYPSSTYYVKAAFGNQPYLSTVAAAMPSPITNVSLDQLTTDSTDFSCSWSAAPSTAVTVRYYSTTSATVPATRSQVGTTQSVDATLSTNSLAPAIVPLSSFFYYVGVTPARGPEVVSGPAFQPIDANLSTATKGSLAFTGGWLSLTSNWTLPIYNDTFTIEAFISTTKPLITTQRDDPNGSGNTLTYWGDVNDYNSYNLFNIETPDNNDYYLNIFNNTRPAGNASALVNTVANGNWHHVVAQGSNNVYSLYYDGKFLGSRAVANYSTFSDYTRFLVGARGPPYNFFKGFMASVRIVNGINVYSGSNSNAANFTVPVEPLTATQSASSNIAAITGVNQNTGPNDPTHISTGNNYTALLLDTKYDTPFLDGSSNAFTLTSNGAVVASRNNPFGPAVYPTRVPDAPTNVVGTPGSEQVTVTWTLPLSNGGKAIASYTVTASPGGASHTINGASVSSYVFTGLTNGTAYTFTVYATNSNGNSALSAASAAVTPAGTAAAPTALVATHGDASASIAFTAGATGGGTISNYKYSTDGGSSFTAFSPAQTTSPVSITGLTNGTTYSVALRAVTQVGDGTASSTVSVTPSTIPGAPTSVSGSHGNTSVALTWSAPANDGGDTIDFYKAAYSSDGTNYTVFGSTFPSTSGTVTGLTNGTAYTFKVSAHNANGDSVYSTASTAVTPSTVPGAPTDVAGTHGNTTVALTWLAPSSTGGANIDYYVVEYSSGGSYTAFGSTFPGLAGTVTGLTNGTAYTFRVSAHNLNGLSSPSAPSAAVTPSTVPGAPTAVSGTSGNTEVSVAWTAPSSNGGAAISSYTVKYSTDGSTYTAFGTTFSSSPGVVTGLANGTAYTFKVFATNVNGDSADSTASAAVTPHFMVWNPAMKGTDVVIGDDGLSVSQQFGYRQTALATRMVTTGERVLYSIQPTQIGPFQTMTVGWGTSNMHYNGTGDAYSGYPGTDDQSVGVDFYGSSFYNSTAQVTQLPLYSTVGDVVDMALHDGVGWWIRVNGGLWNNDPAANPATDAGGLSVQGLTALFPAANPAGGGRADGALLLLETSTYTVPSGYTFI